MSAEAADGSSLVLVERQGEARTALVRLNRPEQLNALNAAAMDALCEALEALDRDDDVRAIVVTGNQRAFAAGADIGEMANATPWRCCARTGSGNGTECGRSGSRSSPRSTAGAWAEAASWR